MKTLLVVFLVSISLVIMTKTLRDPRYVVGRERMYNNTETSSVQKRNGVK